MAVIQPSDQLLVNRANTTKTVSSDKLMASLQTTDLLVVNRADVTYTITGQDLADSIVDPLSLSTPVFIPATPSIYEEIEVFSVAAGGKQPYTYSYQWKLANDAAGTGAANIPGEVTTKYTPVLADDGKYLACEVSASDTLDSSTSKTSAFLFVRLDATVVTPNIVAPANGAGGDTAPEPNLTILGSAFETDPASPGGGPVLGHVSTDWQVTFQADTNFSNPVAEDLNSASLLSWNPPGLEFETAYLARIKYHSLNEESEWSYAVAFTTARNEAPKLPASDFTVVQTKGAPALASVEAGVKFINGASNYGDLFAFGIDSQVYKIAIDGTKSQAGDFNAALGDTAISQGVIGYNGSITIVDTEGGLWMFNAVSFVPDSNNLINHLEGTQLTGSTSFTQTSKISLCWSNITKKIYVGYPDPNVTLTLPGITPFVQPAGSYDKTTACYSKTFGLNPDVDIVQITGAATAYQTILQMYVLFSDGKLFLNGSPVTDATGSPGNYKQFFHLGATVGSAQGLALRSDGVMEKVTSYAGTVIQDTMTWLTAACGYLASTNYIALADDGFWYGIDYLDGSVTQLAIAESNVSSFNARKLDSWGGTINHSAGSTNILVPSF